MKLIIPTCDKYRNILEANKYTIDKFAEGLEVIVLGFKRPDFDLGKWRFISLGEDKSPDIFTNALSRFFRLFKDEYFIYGNDDSVMTAPFNFHVFNDIFEMVKTIPEFGRIWLTGIHSTPYTFNGTYQYNGYCLNVLDQQSNYRLSLQYSLWKTSYFKRYLTYGLNPWQFELRSDAKGDGRMILALSGTSIVSVGHIMRSFNVDEPTLLDGWNNSIYGDSSLDETDTNIIKEIFKKHGIL